MKRSCYAILLIFTVICVLTGCSIPIGSISSGSDNSYNSSPDSMWLVPRRQLYQIDHYFYAGFNDQSDFQIFFVDNGAVLEIDPREQGVVVQISKVNRASNGEYIPIVGTTRNVSGIYSFALGGVGAYKVDVTFRGKDADYALEVQSPNNGQGIGGDGGIGIIWAD